MVKSNENQTYVSMMVDSLKKKKEVLMLLYEKTRKQEELLLSDTMDIDNFETLIEEKGREIEELDKLDEGFDGLYKKLERELMSNQSMYGSEIDQMKSLIKEITGLSNDIQIIEKRNHERFGRYVSEERQKIRSANMSSQTAMTYVQNMAGYHKPGDSYFVNETK